MTDNAVPVPSNADGWRKFGRTAWIKGCREEAIDALRKACELDPGNAWAWNDLGYYLASVGNYSAAAEACERALKLCPWDPEAAMNLNMIRQAIAAENGNKDGSGDR